MTESFSKSHQTWQGLLLWLIILLGKIILWFVLAGYIGYGLARLETTHYQAGDTPTPQFTILVQGDDNTPYPMRWHEYINTPHPLITTPDTIGAEDYLYQDGQGRWVYHNEGALWYSKSTYLINNGQAVPVSYLLFTIGHVFYGMVGASVILILINYIQCRFLYCYQPDKLNAYHQTLWHKIKRFIFWVGVFMVAYGAIEFVR